MFLLRPQSVPALSPQTMVADENHALVWTDIETKFTFGTFDGRHDRCACCSGCVCVLSLVLAATRSRLKWETGNAIPRFAGGSVKKVGTRGFLKTPGTNQHEVSCLSTDLL